MRRTPKTGYGLIGLVLAASLVSGCLGQETEADPEKNADAKKFSLTIASNAIKGGKNSEGATWLQEWVIPRFVKAQKEKGVTAKVKFEPSGVDDEDYKSKISLDMQSGKGADIVDLDGIWVGEFAESGYIKPLNQVVGAHTVESWSGWNEIPDAVRANGSYQNQQYGVPAGTDGRVIFFNKALFEKAGLPADWQPTSWAEIISAAKKLKKLSGVTPLQLNAGTAMGEATTMQAFLPLLAGAGAEISKDGKWAGATEQVRTVFDFYDDVYSAKLSDPVLQKEAKGRDKSFQMFADGKLGMLLESDYLWRDVIDPADGIAPMKNRDSDVGYAKIPAQKPGAGVQGQDFVSMSGGAAQVINPSTDYPQQAWELMQFMASAKAVKEQVGDVPRITQRQDVNDEILADDPLLSFVSDEVIPLTRFRPSDGEYVKVSEALQEATYAVVDGASASDAAAEYQSKLEDTVGADNVSGS